MKVSIVLLATKNHVHGSLTNNPIRRCTWVTVFHYNVLVTGYITISRAHIQYVARQTKLSIHLILSLLLGTILKSHVLL